MLRITINHECNHVVLKLEGKLAGPWVKELRYFWLEEKRGKAANVLVDLRAVTFISDSGKALLEQISRSGATFETAGSLNRYVVDQFRQYPSDGNRNG